ncbi:MAG: hypothetical protein ACWGNP_01265 [Candidatus Bathyarchaeia archaeon]
MTTEIGCYPHNLYPSLLHAINGKVEAAKIYGKFACHITYKFGNQKIKGSFIGTVNNYQVEIMIETNLSSKIDEF